MHEPPRGARAFCRGCTGQGLEINFDNFPYELWVRNLFTILLDEIDDNDLAKDEFD